MNLLHLTTPNTSKVLVVIPSCFLFFTSTPSLNPSSNLSHLNHLSTTSLTQNLNISFHSPSTSTFLIFPFYCILYAYCFNNLASLISFCIPFSFRLTLIFGHIGCQFKLKEKAVKWSVHLCLTYFFPLSQNTNKKDQDGRSHYISKKSQHCL